MTEIYGATSRISNLVVLTVVWNDAPPPVPLQERVYVVVWLGFTVLEPLTPTGPIPLSIEQEFALSQLQEREDDCGGTIAVGEAENTQEGRGGGGVVAVNVCGLEVPPPGEGLVTVTGYAPAVETSEARMDAVSWVVDTKEVVLATPLKLITDEGTKFAPLTMSAEPAPAKTLFGETLVMVGAGFKTVKTLLS